jgi:hypothetical protein
MQTTSSNLITVNEQAALLKISTRHLIDLTRDDSSHASGWAVRFATTRQQSKPPSRKTSPSALSPNSNKKTAAPDQQDGGLKRTNQ